MVTGVVLSFCPPVMAFIVLAQRVQHPLIVDFSPSECVLLTHTLALSESQLVYKKTCNDYLYEYGLGEIRTHEADLYQAPG